MNEETLFHLALAKPPGERAAFLEQACAGDAPQRLRVEALLRAHEAADSFLERPAAAPDATSDHGPDPDAPTKTLVPSPDEQLGDRIGPYKLLQKIGEGGMGAVFMAEQEHPVRRRVALKVIKPGMDTGQVIARFEAERQALAHDGPSEYRASPRRRRHRGRPSLLRHGTGEGRPHHRVLRPQQPLAQGTARTLHPRLPGDPARPPERDHPPRREAQRTCS